MTWNVLLISCSPKKMSSEPHHPLKSQGVAGSKGRWIVSLMQILFSNPGLFSKHLMSEDSLYNVAHKLSHDWMIRSRFFGGAFDTVVIPGIACIDDHWMNIVYPSIHVNPIFDRSDEESYKTGAILVSYQNHNSGLGISPNGGERQAGGKRCWSNMIQLRARVCFITSARELACTRCTGKWIVTVQDKIGKFSVKYRY